MIFAFLFRVVAFDKVSTPGAQPGWYFEGSQRSRGEWIAPTQADGRCSIAARKSSCLGTLCRCETSCLQNATKTVGTQLAKGEATEKGTYDGCRQVGDEAQCPTNNGGMPGMNGDDELRMGKGDCGWRWTEDR
ncbi:hypothetical protein SORBI_3007G090409 [Sorghum bicolor]|nr:hypothetical protein SORBI_3007G090409 [Sorghum bicolor]